METLSTSEMILAGLAFLIASGVYASVGHGGASAYLAVMGLVGLAPQEMRPIALALNIGVSLVALVSFFRAGHFDSRLFAPLAVVSVPAAFIGGLLEFPEPLFKGILAVALLLAAWRLVFVPDAESPAKSSPLVISLLLLGGFIGFLSGLAGIGGGIFLTPLLIFFRWASAKQAAAISAAFIFVNSCAGITGFLAKGGAIPSAALVLLPIVLCGGWLGSQWGSRMAKTRALRLSLATVLIVAAGKFVII
jgi:uncharacterized membrane protein YfcA